MIEKLQPAFKDIKYTDFTHQYFHSDGTELKSVTKFLSSLRPKFNSDFWTIFKAYSFSGYDVKSMWGNYEHFRLLEKDGSETFISINDDHGHLTVTPDDVKKQWETDAMIGKTRGTFVHAYLDNLENRVIDSPKTILPDNLTTAEAVNYINSIKAAKKLCQEFVEFAQENLILIVPEYIVGDLKLGLAGRFDRLYFNKITSSYEIWDFKTDKQIRYKSNFGKLDLFDLPDCEFEKYSLQTSIYKKIIQDNTNIILGDSRVVWFNLKENKYEIITCIDYTKLLTEKLNHEVTW